MSDKQPTTRPEEKPSQNAMPAKPADNSVASEMKSLWSQPESPQPRLAMDHKPGKK